MTADDYRKASASLLSLAQSIETAKRPAYTIGSSDVLRNFKSVAERAGITPAQAWAVYFLKHVDAITAAANNPNIPQAEELSGRFADALNYLKLGWALFVEAGDSKETAK